MSVPLKKTNQLKSIAILMMLCLHLFNRDYNGLFTPLIFIGEQPLSYYISLFSDACVPIFAFVSGYGLYYSYTNSPHSYSEKNKTRTKNLYLRYWIILFIFAVVLGKVMNVEGYPGSWEKLFLNITGLNPSYNGAWWFFTTYILFVFTSRFWFKILDKINPYIFMVFLFAIYVTAFYFRVYNNNIFDGELVNWLHYQSAMYFCTLFQFMLGAFSIKYRWNDYISKMFNNIKARSIIVILGITSLVFLHGLIPNFIIAPFTAICFIFLFLQLRLPKIADDILDFFTPHATNLWLIHMFIYITYFSDLIYAPQYPILIFSWLVFLCVIASYVVNAIYNRALTLNERRSTIRSPAN